MKFATVSLLFLIVFIGTGCASGPRYDTSQLDMRLTPTRVASAAADYRDKQVVWGGVIIALRNQRDYTELELLSYPLDGSQYPVVSGAQQGRFLARYSGYLESVDYAPGRLLTLTGRIDGSVAGKVGESPYTFPVVTVEHLYLWPPDSSAPSSTRFHFGVGVMLH